MGKTVKYIIIGAVILAIIALFIFNDNIEFGAIIAGITGFVAAIKSKLLKSTDVQEKLELVEQEHAIKRSDWENIKEEYDSKFNALKARMDYLDYRSAKLINEISELDDIERRALEENKNLTEAEILDRLRNL